jgi:N-acylneuraminate cytidylyltransferase
MKVKTIAIIPARSGSKRLPHKNRLLLGEYPLVVHSIRYAQLHRTIIDSVYVSADDAAIKEIALAHGVYVIDRPYDVSGDHEPTVSALQQVLQSLDATIENVVLLQPTNPLRPEHLLTECFEKFIETRADSLFTVTQNRHKLGKIIDNMFHPFNYEIGQRSQDLESLYFENGLLYISRADMIRKGMIVSPNAFPHIVEHPYANVDIDTQEDFDYEI